MKRIALMIGLPLTVAALATAAEEKESAKSSEHATAQEHVLFTPSDLKWGDVPPSLPAGGKMAVLEGDPTKKGLFTVRLQSPDGYKIMPHTHPSAEHVTVISGTLRIGMGSKFDEAAAHDLPAGGYVSLPARMQHHAATSGETVVQITSMGPFQIKYVNPEDDPRKAK